MRVRTSECLLLRLAERLPRCYRERDTLLRLLTNRGAMLFAGASLLANNGLPAIPYGSRASSLLQKAGRARESAP